MRDIGYPFFFIYSFINFFLVARKKLQKRSKKPAVLSLIESESSLSRSPIAYYPAQRTRSYRRFRPRARNSCRQNWFITDVLALSEKSDCRTALKRRQTWILDVDSRSAVVPPWCPGGVATGGLHELGVLKICVSMFWGSRTCSWRIRAGSRLR